MSDNLTASLSVGVIYSGDGSGLTPEQEERLNKIPMIEQSVEEITNDLNSKANTSDIPTNTSELYNDSGFLTSIPSEYVTETEMNEAIANSSSGTGGTGLTSEQEEQLNKIPEMETSINNINESLNAKANISDIPTKTSKLTNDSGFLTSIPNEYVTETEMNEAIANVSSGYATKDELNAKANISDIPTKTSKLTNDSGFLTSIPSEYVTETEMNEAIANVSSGGSIDLSGYATKDELNTKANISDIPTKTSKLTNDSGFLTSIPNEYVTETEMNEAITNASSGYATKDELNAKANTSDIPTKVSELYNDSYFVTTSQLNTAISGIQNTNAATIPILPNVVLFGDSITDTKVNGEWVKQIINYAKFNSLTNYGRGYCTFTFKNDTVKNTTDTSNSNVGNNVIWNQYNRMVEDINNRKIPSPDCIIILAGTNDAIQTKTIGDVNGVFNNSAQSTDVKTLTNLCASVRYVCELIMTNYPNAQIILATPLQMKDYNKTSQVILVRNAIISCANKMGIKTIDQTYESGIYAYTENVRPKFLSDGVHLTAEGGKKVAQFLAREFYNKININYYKEETEETITLSSISATFNQGSNKIYNTDSLDKLKNYLTVIATYSDKSTKTITDYVLSGTLTVGTSTITVTYSNKTTTFNVTVSEVETPITTYTITNNLTNVVTNNSSTSVTKGNSYVATLTANSGYTLDNVTVTMAGSDITSSCYSDGSINISNVTGNIIITASAIKTSTGAAVKYFRDELVGNFPTGVWENKVMIPDQVIPAGRYVSFECNVVGFNGGSGTAYLAAYKLTKTGTVNGDVKTGFGFTPVYVKQVTFKKGYNKFDLDYVSNEELYFGFKTANRFFIGLNTNQSSATSTNQQFTRYFNGCNSSYIPSVGAEITNLNNNENVGMAFDCLLTVIPS